jgi:hypothetical protein
MLFFLRCLSGEKKRRKENTITILLKDRKGNRKSKRRNRKRNKKKFTN